MSNTNLKLWDSVQATDPKYTKQFDRGGFKGTAINGTYIAKRLTEAFGPCGIGWKLVLEDERVIPGPDSEQLHVVRCHIDYRLDAERAKDANSIAQTWHSTGPQFGQTLLVQMVKKGQPGQYLKFDEEAPKKSLTDAMSKCASLLGIASDVHLGLYDDNKYVNALKAEKAAATAPAATAAPKVTAEQAQALVTAIGGAGLTAKAFCKKYEIKSVPDLPASRYDEASKDIVDYKAKADAAKAVKP